ncbi:hypothetical protein HOP53_05140 [Halomonas sp. MCCC 1A11081]|uniref:Uncharacterized protein n=2 Tax=Billgrantia ethanolica TaxID=2733486 RepID=A0ABS9A066_9GAMM|nr:hypothetical protein [Halomonas ethanolica]
MREKIKNSIKRSPVLYNTLKRVRAAYNKQENNYSKGSKDGRAEKVKKEQDLYLLSSIKIENIAVSSNSESLKMQCLDVLIKFRNYKSACRVAKLFDFEKLSLSKKNLVVKALLCSDEGVLADSYLMSMVKDQIKPARLGDFNKTLACIDISGLSENEKLEAIEKLKFLLEDPQADIPDDEKEAINELLSWSQFSILSSARVIDPLDYFGGDYFDTNKANKVKYVPSLFDFGHNAIAENIIDHVTKKHGLFSVEAYALNLNYRVEWLQNLDVSLDDVPTNFLATKVALKNSFSAINKWKICEEIYRESLRMHIDFYYKSDWLKKDQLLYLLTEVDELEKAYGLIDSVVTPDMALAPKAIRGYFYLERGDYNSSRDCFLKVLRENPTEAISTTGLRFALPRTGEHMLSLVKIRQAIGYGSKSKGRAGLQNVGGDLTISLLMNGDYINGLYSKRNAPHWVALKKHYSEKFLNYQPLPSDLKDKKIFVIGDEGVGDELRTAQFYNILSTMCDKVVVSCDPRLINLFTHSFEKIKFMPVTRYRKGVREKTDNREKRMFGFDKKVADYLDEKCHAEIESSTCITFGQNLFFNKFIGSLKPEINKGYLKPTYRRQLPRKDKLRVGILWRSHYFIRWRKFMYLKAEDFAPLTKLNGVELWSIQHAINDDEKEFCQNNSINLIEDIDMFNDFEGLASYLVNFDLLIGVSSAPIELGAALGVPVWMLGFSPENYYLRTASGTCEKDQLTMNSTVVAPEWIDFSASRDECCALVFEEVLRRLDSYLK